MGVKTLKFVIIFIQKSRKSEFSEILAELFEKLAEFPAKPEFISDLSFCPKSEKKSLVLLSKQFSLPELLRCTTARKLVAFFPNGVSTSW